MKLHLILIYVYSAFYLVALHEDRPWERATKYKQIGKHVKIIEKYIQKSLKSKTWRFSSACGTPHLEANKSYKKTDMLTVLRACGGRGKDYRDPRKATFKVFIRYL